MSKRAWWTLLELLSTLEIKLEKRQECVKSIIILKLKQVLPSRQEYHNPQKYYNPQIRRDKNASNILTPYAFELLQHEIELYSKYEATKINSDSYVVRHHNKLDGGRLVSLIKDKGQESIHCSCREFKFCGILCRHAIRVLLRESSLIPKSSHITNCNDNSSIDFRSMMQCLETKDRVVVGTKELERVIELVKNISGIPNKQLIWKMMLEMMMIAMSTKRIKTLKGGFEVAKKPFHCHFPNCGRMNHDSINCPNKRKKRLIVEFSIPE
ncbi:hypothetical protein Lal_00012473 [Lupinus albus]|nr:hypothetical protein Lal_00012473 [Lupinus albus]